MKSTKDTYYDAANENLATARWLHEQNRFYLSHYFSGLAAECMLRAYLQKITNKWDSRHDLSELAKESHFYDVVPLRLQKDYSATFQELNRRWRSNHRYLSERQVKDYWNSIQANYNEKGNRLEQISRVAFDLASSIIRIGVAKWQTTK